jgi:hypothetical protein
MASAILAILFFSVGVWHAQLGGGSSSASSGVVIGQEAPILGNQEQPVEAGEARQFALSPAEAHSHNVILRKSTGP